MLYAVIFLLVVDLTTAASSKNLSVNTNSLSKTRSTSSITLVEQNVLIFTTMTPTPSKSIVTSNSTRKVGTISMIAVGNSTSTNLSTKTNSSFQSNAIGLVKASPRIFGIGWALCLCITISVIAILACLAISHNDNIFG
ncbi:hypothetical protein HK096_010286, partial [Nowakowskiella sp. JEL0078]